MDFTSVYLTPKIGHKVETSTVQDFIIVMEFIDQTGRRCREYLDFLCDCAVTNKNDYHFVLCTWLFLFLRKKLNDFFDSIEIWSDGGPHHFKTRYCQWMWSWLSTHKFSGKRITHNFFASYHGHSLADSHAASIKRVLHSEYHTSQIQRFSSFTSALYWGPTNANEFSSLLTRGCSNTQIHIFPHIDRDPKLKPRISSIKEIKKKHCFVYEANTCRAFEETKMGAGEAFSQTIKS